jgi:rRNA maturation endonuclease Nob1
MTTTPQHCPGFEQFKSLKSFMCKCPNCSAEMEIFSDEFDKAHKCASCGKPVNFTECTPESGV